LIGNQYPPVYYKTFSKNAAADYQYDRKSTLAKSQKISIFTPKIAKNLTFFNKIQVGSCNVG
ncbi:MAG: hypothetical protein LBU62_01770, partial [Bacteroidales bacterium]|nr:hypothetical protein [Bacteroidales bacterium]